MKSAQPPVVQLLLIALLPWAIEHQVRRLLHDALVGATSAIEGHRAVHDRFAAALLEHETLEQQDLAALLGPVDATQSEVLGGRGPSTWSNLR